MTFIYIHWNADPTMIDLWGFPISWYGLLFALGFVFGYIIMQKIFQREQIPQKILDNLSLYMFIGTVVGARLGHCFFYEPEYYLAHPIEILYIRQGGLASHGAAIAILISLWIFSKKQKKPFSWIVDRIVIVVALAGFFIRLGNLMNSEIYGQVTHVPWAFIFDRIDNQPRHPSQLYESVAYLLLFFLLYWMYFKRNASKKPYLLFGVFLLGCFGFRFLVEFIKDVQVDFEHFMALKMGQWLSIPFIISGLYFIFRKTKDAK
ncbi:MAG: prolipoprotein diacylglyceryl transferase [Bacteroidales bacterium]|nr:prolipoprotein diacylglyceryl transferase [Bacteroidales bacterium]